MQEVLSEIRITNRPFIQRITDYQNETGEKQATKVVERLACERLAQLDVIQANNDRTTEAGTGNRKDTTATVSGSRSECD